MLTVRNLVMLVGVIMVVLAAFGLTPSFVSLFELGCGVCFASTLVPQP